MIEQLTTIERQRALVLLLVVTLAGLVMLIAGKDEPLGIHGALVMVVVDRRDLLPDRRLLRARAGRGPPRPLLRRPDQGRHPARDGLGRLGLFVGDWVAWLLA